MDLEAAQNQTQGDSSHQTSPDLTALKLAVRAKQSPRWLRQSRPDEPAASLTQAPCAATGEQRLGPSQPAARCRSKSSVTTDVS